MKKSWTIGDLNDMRSFAQALVRDVSKKARPAGATILTLNGNLGAGKTTLTQLVGKELGVTEKINSPTFVISKTYPLTGRTSQCRQLVHIDAYRLENENLDPLGFDAVFADPANLVIIEWPSLIEHTLPTCRTDITITHDPQTGIRQIDITNTK